jgi:hypothetical protein
MDIQAIEQFFKDRPLPSNIQLDKGTSITNVRKFVDSHLAVLKQYEHSPMSAPFADRLVKVAEMLEAKYYK